MQIFFFNFKQKTTLKIRTASWVSLIFFNAEPDAHGGSFPGYFLTASIPYYWHEIKLLACVFSSIH